MKEIKYRKIDLAKSNNFEINVWFPVGVEPGLENDCHIGGVEHKEELSGKDRDMMFYRKFAILPEQTHGVNVGIVDNLLKEDIVNLRLYEQPIRFPETDALITFYRGVRIGVVTADCVPIVVYAPDVNGIAAVHAGWKGTLNGIVDNTIEIFKKYGAAPEKMIAIFGPSISCENYEVDEDLAEKFIKAGFERCVFFDNAKQAHKATDQKNVSSSEYISSRHKYSKPHIDLQGVNRERLIRSGLLAKNIQLSSLCTFSSLSADGIPMLQSYRRDGLFSGRNLTTICLK